MLSDRQRKFLLRPITPKRVLHKDGQSHLPAFDVVAHLTRVFGFEGWDKEIIALDLINATRGHPTDQSKKNWYITYRCLMRLTIRDPQGNVVKVIEEGATGSCQNMPSEGDGHDFAMKNAISFAIKRCAKDLGDQFGLSLYNKGSTAQLIFDSAAYGDDSAPPAAEGDLPAPLSMGNDELQDDGDPGPIPPPDDDPLPPIVDAGTGEILPEPDPSDQVPARVVPVPVPSTITELKVVLNDITNTVGDKQGLRGHLLTKFGPIANRTVEQMQESVTIAAGWS